MIEFRDRVVRDELGLELLVHINEEGVSAGINPVRPRQPASTPT